MADMRDRGQIILVAAFALAVIFVSLALIVNSAIFTENLASRGETSGSDGALGMRAMVESNAGSNLERVNRAGINNYADLQLKMDTSLAELSNQIGQQEAKKGRLVNVSGTKSHTEGKRIFEDEDADPLAPTDSYTPVTDVSRVTTAGGVTENGTRAFRIEVTDITDTNSTDSLTISASGTGTWQTDIYQVGTTDTVRVETENGFGETDACEVTLDDISQPFQTDITDGTIDDKPCSALRRTGDGRNFAFAAGAGDTYTIGFGNADLVTGVFSMTVHSTTTSTINTPDSITSEQALYDVTVRYGYSTSDLTYVSDVRVAPGEPDE